MSRACILVALVALSAGCRERNPEWLGPASESSGTSNGPSTTDTSASSSGSSSSSSSSSSSETTDGEPIPCNNDNQCPDDLLCGPQGCQVGEEGEPCDRDRDCGDMAPICSSAGSCQDGSPGDPCSEPDDCTVACEGEVCVDGSTSSG